MYHEHQDPKQKVRILHIEERDLNFDGDFDDFGEEEEYYD